MCLEKQKHLLWVIMIKQLSRDTERWGIAAGDSSFLSVGKYHYWIDAVSFSRKTINFCPRNKWPVCLDSWRSGTREFSFLPIMSYSVNEPTARLTLLTDK